MEAMREYLMSALRDPTFASPAALSAVHLWLLGVLPITYSSTTWFDDDGERLPFLLMLNRNGILTQSSQSGTKLQHEYVTLALTARQKYHIDKIQTAAATKDIVVIVAHRADPVLEPMSVAVRLDKDGRVHKTLSNSFDFAQVPHDVAYVVHVIDPRRERRTCVRWLAMLFNYVA
jgi:hypothetical protein